ncbi:MAG: DNA gyrase subunit A [Gammaproteobacteria bacterium]|nr:DNA gyrase subunit A [Gammaproteobacteria bacterium]
MLDHAKEIVAVNIEDELQQSYLDYAMSVIVGRALPDVRDGLKPVHRRVLFAMSELKNDFNKPYKKSARIVGDVIGKYHPHGDTAVYDTIVRMAQPFSLRYMLVDGQGNFGSVDGDAPAAMRYTEIRMSKIAHSLLADLEKETVDFVPNYDGSEHMPSVLPTQVPNLLVNGSSGIAVGMATNIPPHNLNEVIDGCIAIIDNPNCELSDLMQLIPGPDFPTFGIINGRAGIVEAYKTGRGRVLIRGKTNFEDVGEKQAIIITELPYQVNKARLIEKVAELVKEKRLEGITALRDESDKDGMRIYIELRRGENAEVVLNNLYSQTQLQVVFGINMVALDQGRPRCMGLKHLLEAFIRHRREVVTRRTIFDLRKARERAHVLEGLGIALANIDEVIAMIKSSKTPLEAKERLVASVWRPGAVLDMLERAGSDASRPEDLPEEYGLKPEGYHLSPDQAQAILDLRLHRLTGLEKDKILNEYKQLLDLIKDLLEILSDADRLMQVIRDELLEIKGQFGDERRTVIIDNEEELSMEDLIPNDTLVVTISSEGYAKTQPLEMYQAQHRGGKGKSSTSMKEEDYIEHLLVANAHDTLLCFSNKGKLFWLKAYKIPQASRAAKGRPLVNLLPLGEGECISAILPISEFDEGHFVFMATAKGTVKKVSLSQFSRPRNSGLIALDIREGDDLVGVIITDGKQDIMLVANTGKVIRFEESLVRPMGRTAAGVRGIRLKEGQRLISLLAAKDNEAILLATANGYGKRTEMSEFRRIGRGGQGVIGIIVNERNGEVVGAEAVTDQHEILLITDQGTIVRTRVEEISLVGRNTQGVRLINVSEGEQLVGMRRVEEVIDVAPAQVEGQPEA